MPIVEFTFEGDGLTKPSNAVLLRTEDILVAYPRQNSSPTDFVLEFRSGLSSGLAFDNEARSRAAWRKLKEAL